MKNYMLSTMYLLLQSILYAQLELPYEVTNTVRPNDLQMADMDGDGFEDIISVDEEGVGWCRNLGDYSYAIAEHLINWPGENSMYHEVCASDMDLDGDMDVVVSRSSGYEQYFQLDLWLIENTGAMVFAEPEIIADDIGFNRLDMADFDSDGYADLALATTTGLSIYHNEGAGGFSVNAELEWPYSSIPELNLIDLDQDGLTDITLHCSDGFLWYAGLPGGEFAEPETLFLGFGLTGYPVSFFDHDADGDLDIYYFWNSGVLDDNLLFPKVKINNGFQFSNTVDIEIPLDIWSSAPLFFTDHNIDGVAEAIALTAQNELDPTGHLFLLNWESQNSLTIVQDIPLSTQSVHFGTLHELNFDDDDDIEFIYGDNVGNGWLPFDIVNEELVQLPFLDLSHSCGFPEATDVDQDGDLDIVALTFYSHGLVWYENLLTHFSEMQIIDEQASAYLSAANVVVEDFDFDGDDDIMLTQLWDASVKYYENADGTFGLPMVVLADYHGQDAIWTDINGDQFLDCVYKYYEDGFLYCRYGSPSEPMGITPVALTEMSVHTFISADIESDGDNDLLYTISDGGFGWILHRVLNNGLSFSEWETFSVSLPMFSLFFAFGMIDWNNDGWRDVVSQYSMEESSVVLLMNNEGVLDSFDVPYQFSGSVNMFFDYNTDGLVDFLAFNEETYTLYYNEGDGTFVPAGIVALPVNPTASENMFNDFDLDGKFELLYGYLDEVFIIDLLLNAFPNAIEGWVFYDMNTNGIQDNDESVIPMFPVLIESNNETAYFAGNGYFYLTGNTGDFIITPQYDPAIWQLTTDSAFYQFSIVEEGVIPAYDLVFGFAPVNDSPNALTGTWPLGWSCITDEFISHTTLQNTGNTMLSGIISMQYDNTLVGPLDFIDEPDSVDSNIIYWYVDSLLPTEQASFNILFEFPELELLGQFSTFQTSFTRDTLPGDLPLILHSEDSVLVSCSFDPNDKSVMPMGFGMEGFMLAGEVLEYTIRFQNTGNAPAENVVIIDPLSGHFAEESFQLITASHDVVVQHNEEGMITFSFNEIFLPDSGSNYMESMGFVVFSVQLDPMIDPGIVVGNVAYIFFDNNPPIITNTVLNTIYTCEWLYDPVEISEQNSMLYAATGCASYQWFLDDELLIGDTSFVLSPEYSGTYSVLYSYEIGCEFASEDFFYNGIEIVQQSPCIFYPVPANHILKISCASTSANYYFIYDSTGKIRSGGILSGLESVDLSSFADGLYYISIRDGWGQQILSETLIVN